MSIQSLRTGVSGLTANQTRLDTISNNISNSSTVAFKKERAVFSEVLGQEVLGAERSASGDSINPSKVGRGVSLGSVDKNFEQGSLDQTGIKTDLALSGDGFFVASPGEGANLEESRLTRAGNFNLNKDGELVTSGGLNVQGWDVGEDGKAQTGELKNVQFDPNAQSEAKLTSEAKVGGNLSADAEEDDTSTISSVVYDDQGKAQDVVIEFKKNSADDKWSFTVKDPQEGGGPGGNGVFDEGGSSDGDVLSGEVTFNDDGAVESISATGGEGTVYDDDDDPSNEGVQIDWLADAVEGTSSKPMKINLEDITQYSGSTTAKFQSQNGYEAGELRDFGVTSEGKLQLNFTNGKQETAAQLAIGDVNNPNGLEQQGDNFFTTTGASGDLQLGRAGRDLQTSVVSGSLESSNVDLADEFAGLIEAQRSYQASSRVVTTADQVLQETVGLKR